MTLEDQIRRMGESRAAEVSTPSWRDRVGGSGGRPWRWVGATAAVVVLVVGGFVLLPGDDSDTEVTGDASAIEHWIPAAGVDRIEYPGALGGLFYFANAPEVALITPSATGDPLAAGWTRVEGGSSWHRRTTNDADDFATRDTGGVATLSLDRDDITVARITSTTYTSDELAERASDLFTISREVDLLADAIAEWDDSVVRYVGPPVVVDATITSPTDDDDFVARLATQSPEQFVASYGNASRSPRFMEEYFALETAETASLTPEFFNFPADDPPVMVSNDEWLAIVDDVIGANPEVSFPGSELFGGAEGMPLLSRPAASAFTRADGHWSVRLNYPEPASFRDGGAIDVRIGGVTLTFGPAEPGIQFESLAIGSRLTEGEARRYADLINDSVDRTEPPEPTPAPYPTTGPIQTGVCAANPIPADDVLDIATHIAADRNPLDLDQDGVDDEMLIYDDADGNWFLLARLQAGWTNAVDIGSPTQPGLAQTSDGVPAGKDLDGDGQLEFFVTGYLGPTAGLVTLRGCELVDSFFVDEPAEGLGASVGVQIGFSDDTPLCEGRACATRVRCAGGVLTQELWIGTAANDAAGSWGAGEIRLNSDGVITTTERPTRIVGPFETAGDPPTEATTGVIDCTPEDGHTVPIARPECAGNTPPPPGSDPRSLEPSGLSLDVDGDGLDDELVSFIGDDDRVKLVLHLGNGDHTNSVPVWFEGTATPLRPSLALTPDQEIAAADLTGNGSAEVFIAGFGNTARSAALVGLEGCTLRSFAADVEIDDSLETAFGVLIGVGGNSCAPTGCVPRVSCVDGVLITENTGPVEAFDPEQPLSAVEVRWTTEVWDYRDDRFVVSGDSESTFFATERPADAPRVSDVIDCRP